MYETDDDFTAELTFTPKIRSVALGAYLDLNASLIHLQTTTALWKAEDAIGNKASVDMPTHH